jgi:hypothetical protein
MMISIYIAILISFYMCHGSEASSDSDPAEWPCTLLVWESSGRVSYDGNMVV